MRLESVLLAAVFLVPAHAQQPDFPIRLAQGVMAGEVAETSVILQSRLTSANPWHDPRWQGVPGIEGVARFEIADNEAFRNSRLTEWLDADPSYDFIVKTEVRGLARATRHYYRLHYGPDRDDLRTSGAATFRTLAGAGQTEAYSFAVVTGMNYSFFHYMGRAGRSPPYQGPDKHLGYPALARILELKPDFFVGTGDNVYYDHPGVIGRAETRHQMRMKHHEQYSQPRFLELFQSAATYWLKDDHDHRFNDSDAVNPVLVRERPRDAYYPKRNIYPGWSSAGFEPSHELGIEIFREQLPVADPRDPDAVTYRTHRVSRLLQVWFVEGRDYRSPNDMPDGPEKTIWGAEQKAWLKRTLLESDASFKLLVSATPMVGPDGAGKRDNHVNINGFRHEGQEFFRWLSENGFSPNSFFIACGDRHWQYHAIHPSGFEEFSAGALVDENASLGILPGAPNSTDPEGLIQQPYHYEEPTGGFLLITVKPSADETEGLAVFDFYDDEGRRLYTHTKRVSGP